MAKAFADGSRPAGPAYHAPLMTSLGSPGGGRVKAGAAMPDGCHHVRLGVILGRRCSPRRGELLVWARARRAVGRAQRASAGCGRGIEFASARHQSSLINGSHRLPKLEMARSHRGRGPGSQLAALMAGNGREPVGLRVGEAAAHLDGVRRWMAGDGPRTEGTAEGNMDVCGCFDFPPAHDATFHVAGLASQPVPIQVILRHQGSINGSWHPARSPLNGVSEWKARVPGTAVWAHRMIRGRRIIGRVPWHVQYTPAATPTPATHASSSSARTSRNGVPTLKGD
ncbi:predicted protein [Postia placenta Mad-698-R]|nr:predicted protein [Postia placenta Mad-698-R]